MTYARFGGQELLEDLQPLCHGCHLELHRRGRKVKREIKARAAKKRIPGVKGVRWEIRDGKEYRVLIFGDPGRRR